MKQFATFVCAVVVGVVLGQWMIAFPRPSQTSFSPAVTPVGKYGRSFGSAPAVTLPEYTLVRSGMSYWEVCSILGEAGTEISRNHMDGVAGVMESIDTVMYQWSNDDGSNMNAMFQNDKMIQKAQFGLQ